MTIIDHPGQMLLFADLGIDITKSTAHVGKRATISKGGASTHAGEKRRANANAGKRPRDFGTDSKLMAWLWEAS